MGGSSAARQGVVRGGSRRPVGGRRCDVVVIFFSAVARLAIGVCADASRGFDGKCIGGVCEDGVSVCWVIVDGAGKRYDESRTEALLADNEDAYPGPGSSTTSDTRDRLEPRERPPETDMGSIIAT